MNISSNSGMKRLASVLLLSSSLTLVALTAPAQASDLDRFFQSHYTYCDAKLIGDLWGISVEDAKAQIGMKIRTGIGGNIPSVLRLSRQSGNACEWVDTGYSYEDAEKLSQIWGDSTDDAKAKVAQYLTNGQRYIVERALH